MNREDSQHPVGVNMVVNFFAATVFTVLMCAFWWVIGSREVSEAVQRKADILYSAREKLEDEPLLRDLATMMDVRINQLNNQLEVVAKEKEAYRRFQNRQLMTMWMAPIIALYGGLLCGAIVYNLTRTHVAGDTASRSLSFGHWCGILLVFFSYIPEILFFLFVIEWKVPIGDYEMGLRMCGFH